MPGRDEETKKEKDGRTESSILIKCKRIIPMESGL